MNHYMNFDPYMNRERNEQIRKEVNSLRLEGGLRKGRNPRGSRLAALVERARLAPKRHTGKIAATRSWSFRVVRR